eukprot:comp14779_c0_seq2/m.11208 comp14779_c0_seq2/g.11208  ORF comp14779_c0_seq2/g.11208 comp14779_c0_seq2/m.11208 type:complete len:263 (-) comp14779_c0_seq2:24-812(-)
MNASFKLCPKLNQSLATSNLNPCYAATTNHTMSSQLGSSRLETYLQALGNEHSVDLRVQAAKAIHQAWAKWYPYEDNDDQEVATRMLGTCKAVTRALKYDPSPRVRLECMRTMDLLLPSSAHTNNVQTAALCAGYWHRLATVVVHKAQDVHVGARVAALNLLANLDMNGTPLTDIADWATLRAIMRINLSGQDTSSQCETLLTRLLQEAMSQHGHGKRTPIEKLADTMRQLELRDHLPLYEPYLQTHCCMLLAWTPANAAAE